jgi:hypothetical protein
MGMGQNISKRCIVHSKIAGKWRFVPGNMVPYGVVMYFIGFDPS